MITSDDQRVARRLGWSRPFDVDAFAHPGVAEVLRAHEVDPERFLGFGGEAWVWAIDDDRVLRVCRDGSRLDHVLRRYDLVAELGSAGAPWALPEALDSGTIAERDFVIERRLDGRPVRDELGRLGRDARDRLVVAHLEAAAALGDLHLDPRGYWGDLIVDDPLRSPTWSEYLHRLAEHNLAVAPDAFGAIDPAEIAGVLPPCDTPSFVHLDAFTGNMLAAGPTITAVIDFGPMSIVGDRRIDPLSAAVYLCADQITPEADAGDRAVALAWVDAQGWTHLFEPVRRWLAVYWCWAVEDRKLQDWCREVLLG